MKLSQWHDGNVKPVHVGVYESDEFCGDGVHNSWFRKWDGINWFKGSESLKEAERNFAISYFQNWPWRGIVKEEK